MCFQPSHSYSSSNTHHAILWSALCSSICFFCRTKYFLQVGVMIVLAMVISAKHSTNEWKNEWMSAVFPILWVYIIIFKTERTDKMICKIKISPKSMIQESINITEVDTYCSVFLETPFSWAESYSIPCGSDGLGITAIHAPHTVPPFITIKWAGHPGWTIQFYLPSTVIGQGQDLIQIFLWIFYIYIFFNIYYI